VTYRSRTHGAANLVLALLVGVVVLAVLGPARPQWNPARAAVAAVVGAALLWLFVARVVLAGVHVDRDGLRVVEPFRTVRIPWSHVQGFGFGRWNAAFPRVGWVQLTTGKRVMLWPIQGSLLLPGSNREAERLIRALDAELAARTGQRAAGP
jgi:hypothetical protein